MYIDKLSMEDEEIARAAAAASTSRKQTTMQRLQGKLVQRSFRTSISTNRHNMDDCHIVNRDAASCCCE